MLSNIVICHRRRILYLEDVYLYLSLVGLIISPDFMYFVKTFHVHLSRNIFKKGYNLLQLIAFLADFLTLCQSNSFRLFHWTVLCNSFGSSNFLSPFEKRPYCYLIICNLFFLFKNIQVIMNLWIFERNLITSNVELIFLFLFLFFNDDHPKRWHK